MTAPSQADLRRGEAMTWGPPPSAELPKMRLLEWVPVGKGALVGKAKIWLPPGLEISDLAIFAKDGKQWAQFPGEPMRDRDGQPLVDGNNRIRYRSSIRWATRELQDRFSAAIVALISTAHPGALTQ